MDEPSEDQPPKRQRTNAEGSQVSRLPMTSENPAIPGSERIVQVTESESESDEPPSEHTNASLAKTLQDHPELEHCSLTVVT